MKDRTFEYISENYLIKLGQLDKKQRNCKCLKRSRKNSIENMGVII